MKSTIKSDRKQPSNPDPVNGQLWQFSYDGEFCTGTVITGILLADDPKKTYPYTSFRFLPLHIKNGDRCDDQVGLPWHRKSHGHDIKNDTDSWRYFEGELSLSN